MPQNQRSACRGAKSIYIIINQWIESKMGNSHIVRANACPHYAIILALTAQSTMNKGMETKYESMRAKKGNNSYGRIKKNEFRGELRKRKFIFSYESK